MNPKEKNARAWLREDTLEQLPLTYRFFKAYETDKFDEIRKKKHAFCSKLRCKEYYCFTSHKPTVDIFLEK